MSDIPTPPPATTGLLAKPWLLVAGVVGLCALCGCAVVGIGLATGLAPSLGEFFQRPSEGGPSENPSAENPSAENPAQGFSAEPTATYSYAAPQAPSAPGGAPGYDQAQNYAGSWAGSWQNQTFGSSGPMDASVEVFQDGTTTFTMDLGGMVFGLLDPDPATYQGSYNDGGAFFTIPDDPVFGELTIVISADGSVVVSAPDVPDNRILSFSATGTITPDTLHLDYLVLFLEGTPAQGVIDMDRTP